MAVRLCKEIFLRRQFLMSNYMLKKQQWQNFCHVCGTVTVCSTDDKNFAKKVHDSFLKPKVKHRKNAINASWFFRIGVFIFRYG